MSDDPNHPGVPDDAMREHYLAEWRDFMGWTQEELAEMAGVHFTTIGRIENGKRKLKTHFLRDLARIFGVPQSALLDVNPATDEGKQTAELLLAWNELPKDKRADILTMIRALTGRSNKSEVS